MTHQEFNYLYYKFTKNKKGIKPYDRISTTGCELKEFLEYSIKEIHFIKQQQAELNF